MTLQEAIRAAEAGDVEVMYSLGSYYFDQKQVTDSLEWFFKATQLGHLSSAKK